MALPKKNRLKGKREFKRVLEKGKGFKEDFLILKVFRNFSNLIRFGFLVSQKISKKATIRNKIKRRLSELVRVKLKKIKNGIDGILIPLPGIEKKEFFEIERILNNLFKRAKILKDESNN